MARKTLSELVTAYVTLNLTATTAAIVMVAGTDEDLPEADVSQMTTEQAYAAGKIHGLNFAANLLQRAVLSGERKAKAEFVAQEVSRMMELLDEAFIQEDLLDA